MKDRGAMEPTRPDSEAPISGTAEAKRQAIRRRLLFGAAAGLPVILTLAPNRVAAKGISVCISLYGDAIMGGESTTNYCKNEV